MSDDTAFWILINRALKMASAAIEQYKIKPRASINLRSHYDDTGFRDVLDETKTFIAKHAEMTSGQQ